MTEEIIERLEEYLGSEEFEYEAENCMEELDESGEGINAVLPLLRFLERHPMADISMTSGLTRGCLTNRKWIFSKGAEMQRA